METNFAGRKTKFYTIDSQFVLEPTFETRYFAASFMLISSLADVSNHLRNPLSLQYSSIWVALFTKPSFAWSHCQMQKKTIKLVKEAWIRSRIPI